VPLVFEVTVVEVDELEPEVCEVSDVLLLEVKVEEEGGGEGEAELDPEDVGGVLLLELGGVLLVL